MCKKGIRAVYTTNFTVRKSTFMTIIHKFTRTTLIYKAITSILKHKAVSMYIKLIKCGVTQYIKNKAQKDKLQNQNSCFKGRGNSQHNLSLVCFSL